MPEELLKRTEDWEYGIYKDPKTDSDCISLMLYIGSNKKFITVPKEISGIPVMKIGSDALDKVRGLIEKIEFENGCGIETIPTRFCSACNRLTKVILQDCVSAIGSYAFYACEELNEFPTPSELQHIGHSSFFGCHSLEQFPISGKTKVIGPYAFSRACIRYASYPHAFFPESLQIIGEGAFSYSGAVSADFSKTKIDVIPFYAFSNCTVLQTADLSPCTKIIAQEAFANCSSLQLVRNTEHVENIRRHAFCGCDNLHGIKLYNLKEIDGTSLDGCQNLRIRASAKARDAILAETDFPAMRILGGNSKLRSEIHKNDDLDER